jgi:hypothetical protein
MAAMIEVLDYLEEVTAYPKTPTGLSAAAQALAPEVVWDRIYSWIAWRWGTTLAEWKCCGGEGDEFILPLTPATVTNAAYWNPAEQDWIGVTFALSPRGIELPSSTTWRISAICGGEEDAPEAVQEAYRRLAEYMVSGQEGPAFASSITSGELSIRMRPDHVGRALQYSGAADLLRPYRKLGRD